MTNRRFFRALASGVAVLVAFACAGAGEDPPAGPSGPGVGGTPSGSGGFAPGVGGSSTGGSFGGSTGGADSGSGGDAAGPQDECAVSDDCSAEAGACVTCEVGDKGTKVCVSHEPPQCGDGVLGPCELCEAGDTRPCTDIDGESFVGGEAACGGDCVSWDTSACHICSPGTFRSCLEIDATAYTGGLAECSPLGTEWLTEGCTYCGDGETNGIEACDGSRRGAPPDDVR